MWPDKEKKPFLRPRCKIAVKKKRKEKEIKKSNDNKVFNNDFDHFQPFNNSIFRFPVFWKKNKNPNNRAFNEKIKIKFDCEFMQMKQELTPIEL